jgi:hypothetical protein
MSNLNKVPVQFNPDENLTAVINGKPYQWTNSHPSFHQAVQAYKDQDWDRLVSLADVEKSIEDFFMASKNGTITVSKGVVYYKDEPIHNYTVDTILRFMRGGYDAQPILNFLEKLMENPSRRSVQELYKFLQHKFMPLLPNGNFLAYKGVREDYTDWHTGKFSNKVGETLEMSRNQVCDDARIGCSYGFHAGSYEYAKGYGDRGHLMMVEINPADVVSVPDDCECQKLRTAKYVVKDHCMKKEERPFVDDYEDDYDDDEDDDMEALNDYDSDDSEWDSGYEQGRKDKEAEILKALGGSSHPSKMTEAKKKRAAQGRDAKGRFC